MGNGEWGEYQVRLNTYSSKPTRYQHSALSQNLAIYSL